MMTILAIYKTFIRKYIFIHENEYIFGVQKKITCHCQLDQIRTCTPKDDILFMKIPPAISITTVPNLRLFVYSL